MKKVVILGSTGMLGNSVVDVFERDKTKEIFCSYRNPNVARGTNSFYFNALTSDLKEIPQCEYLINCIGIIKPFMEINISDSIFINSIFPINIIIFICI